MEVEAVEKKKGAMLGAAMGLGLFLLAVAGLIYTALSGASGSRQGVGVGSLAPEIVGKTTGGADLALSDYKGKVVVLDFWATWCPPCREKIPTMIALQEEFRDKDVQVIGVSGDRDFNALKNYEIDHGINFPTIFEGGQQALQTYGIRGIPTIVVVDREGVVLFRDHHGDIRSVIQTALSGS